jgi:hypothetical protein
MGRILPKAAEDNARVDYGPLMGFCAPTVRVDPHTHIATPSTEANLRDVAEIIRAKRASVDSSSS